MELLIFVKMTPLKFRWRRDTEIRYFYTQKTMILLCYEFDISRSTVVQTLLIEKMLFWYSHRAFVLRSNIPYATYCRISETKNYWRFVQKNIAAIKNSSSHRNNDILKNNIIFRLFRNIEMQYLSVFKKDHDQNVTTG